ncbi:glucosamine-6-phosphate acetyltransferase [Penaeus vannamei]|uniref:Glucosamine-6-phosphate acetyltransferase n=1 Tax=Penaeus vannamei TaxID=6689 RepID=A0A3R7MEZ9_PENVA|nr:glucosamine-6-phosphate acetyltransferase [Penaeus vannamei]
MGAPDIQLPSVGPEDAEAPLYDPGLLAKLDWSKVTHMKGGVTNHAPGTGLRVRPLCKADYDRGFLQLLSQLTKVGDISREKFNDLDPEENKCRYDEGQNERKTSDRCCFFCHGWAGKRKLTVHSRILEYRPRREGTPETLSVKALAGVGLYGTTQSKGMESKASK